MSIDSDEINGIEQFRNFEAIIVNAVIVEQKIDFEVSMLKFAIIIRVDSGEWKNNLINDITMMDIDRSKK